MKRAICIAVCASLLLTAAGCSDDSGSDDPVPTVTDAVTTTTADTPVVQDTRPVLDGATLVTFGDSLTAQSTWPMEVAEQLNMKLVNSGIGANNTEHAADRFERDVTAHDPDYVLMCFGSNDFNRAGNHVDIDTYTANLQSFVDQTVAIGATPILMTPPFISESASGGAALYPEGSVNKALDVYVDAMRTVAADNDVHLIDIHEVCETQNASVFLSGDGVHLSVIGNSIYTSTICGSMTEWYRNDPTAPRVEVPTPPPAAEGAYTADIVPYDIAEWLIIYPETAEGENNDDGSVSFWNTNGQWPEVHYSPAPEQMITVPVKGTTLTIDAELTAGANFMLFFNGPTPTHPYDSTCYTALTPYIKNADRTVLASGDDLYGNQHIQVTLDLETVVPKSCVADDGTVVLSGVKVFVVGGAYLPVTIHEISITTAG